MRQFKTSLFCILALLLSVSASFGQSMLHVAVYFDNTRLEMRDQARGDSSAIPFAEYPVPRTMASAHPVRQAVVLLLLGPTQTEADSGYSTNLENLRLNRFALHRGKAVVRLRGNKTLKGTLSGPRLRRQVEKTLRQFKTVKRVDLWVNGSKTFDSMK